MEKIIKLFIHAGHGGNDRGAIGINGLNERACNIRIRDALLKKLKKHNEFDILTMTDDMLDKTHSSTNVINVANSFTDCDLAIDIHCNSGGGEGFEVWVGKSGLCDAIAVEFCNSMKSIVKVRGIKTKQRDDGRDSLYFIRDLVCPSCILETAFVDNERDSNILRYNTDLIATAYYDAICNYYGVSKKVVSQKPKYYYVQVGTFGIRDNAEHMVKQLNKLGFNAFIKEE